MVNIVDIALAVLEIDQHAQHRQDVFTAQHPHLVIGFKTETGIQLDPANR